MSSMNKAFFMKKEDRNPQWVHIDATDEILGRLSTKIADILRGKNKPEYTPHTDTGDYVVVTNADKIKFSREKKWDTVVHLTYSGYIGGQKSKTAGEMAPEDLIYLAVRRMLPKSKMGKAMFGKLKVYAGNEHPHQAQIKNKN